MGRTAAPGRTVVVAAVAAVAALLGGCGSVGTWTPASGGGDPVAAGRGGDAGTASPSPSWSPAVESTGTMTPTESVAPTPSPSSAEPTPTQRPSATPSATPSPTPTPTAKPRTSLIRGDQGPKVLALQRRLSELGYWLGEPDGSFGSLTQQAVYALQKSAGISRDGIVGPRTKRALERGVRPRVTLSGDGVEIVLERQLLVVVRDGRASIILNTSTGNGEEYTSTGGYRTIATTPRGGFTVYRAVDGPLTNSLGQLWRPRFFHRGFAVHGSPNIPPYAASHGCARLSNAAIDMIWARDLMPIGTRVVVR